MNKDQDRLEIEDLGVASEETRGASGNPQETLGRQVIGIADLD